MTLMILESWRTDGKGQSRIDSLRSDSQAWPDKAQWVAEQRQKPECVLITRSCADGQSLEEKVVWQRPGYVDPCAVEMRAAGFYIEHAPASGEEE